MNNNFEANVQNKINETAKMLIEACPEIAENNPSQIGEMAKMMVFDALEIAIEKWEDYK